jgi:hypothetical protein
MTGNWHVESPGVQGGQHHDNTSEGTQRVCWHKDSHLEDSTAGAVAGTSLYLHTELKKPAPAKCHIEYLAKHTLFREFLPHALSDNMEFFNPRSINATFQQASLAISLPSNCHLTAI